MDNPLALVRFSFSGPGRGRRWPLGVVAAAYDDGITPPMTTSWKKKSGIL
jgi:hypothetical protein